MQKQTFSVLFFIRRTKLLKTGETPIQMRLTLCGQNTEIQLPMEKPRDFDPFGHAGLSPLATI